MSGRPNILFISTDQQTWDAVSAYGNRWVNTPHLDRLAAAGTSFMRSYCTDPVCAPARTSWATGRYTSEAGVPFNGGRLHADLPDLGQLLRAGGYGAYHAGKWHVDGRDVTGSFATLYFGARRILAGTGEFYDPATTHAALQFLTRYDGARPFYLQLGFVNPHDVCEHWRYHSERETPDPVAQGILREEELPPLPDNFHYDPQEPLLQRVARRDDDCLIHWNILRRVRKFSALQWRYLAWSLYRFVEKVDAEIGLVLDALAASRWRDDTIVIFSADHGEAAGRHRMFQKFTLYEESVRTPLVVASLGDRLPVAKGRRLDHLVSGVDLPATVCDYAAIPAPPRCLGRSLRPLVEGRGLPRRDRVYLESNYWGRALVTATHKYVTEYRPKAVEDYVPPGPDSAERGLEQLFDLRADPGETRNLAGAPAQAATLAELREALAAEERRLEWRPLAPGRPRAVVDQWGARLRRRWQEGPDYAG